MNLMILVSTAVLTSSPFTVAEQDGAWSFVTPQGRPWLSVGVCCTNPGLTWSQYDPDNHGYAGFRLQPNEKKWTTQVLSNLRSWGFNSLAGWSSWELNAKHGGDLAMPFFEVLHLGSYHRAPWDDMFDPAFEQSLIRAADDLIPKLRENPNLVGYFTDNELGWWDDTLFLNYLKMPKESPGRQRMMQHLEQHYSGDFGRLRQDWRVEANSWEELRNGGRMWLRPGTQGMAAVEGWTAVLANHYYSTVHGLVRARDPERLILGDRYAQFYELAVVRASQNWIDVASTNYGAEFDDGSISRYFLDTLYAITEKPLIVGEFYVNANQNRSGNRNSIKAFPIVETQRERAAFAAKNLFEMARRPWVIGLHWFQYYDHPRNGRAMDGEDNNMGLVDTNGRPYAELIRAFQQFDWAKARLTRLADTARSIPKAPRQPMSGLTAWPRETGWIRPQTAEAFADLYVCQDGDALYVGFVAQDYIDETLYDGERIPESERPMLRLRLNDSAPMEVRFMGKDRKAIVSDSRVGIWEQPGLKHHGVLRIPWLALSPKPAKIRLSAEMSQHSRANTMSWNTELEVQ